MISARERRGAEAAEGSCQERCGREKPLAQRVQEEGFPGRTGQGEGERGMCVWDAWGGVGLEWRDEGLPGLRPWHV